MIPFDAQEFEAPASHGCIRLYPGGDTLKKRYSPTDSSRRHSADVWIQPGECGITRLLLLLIGAFSGDAFKTVDEKWVNPSTARRVGGSNEHLVTGLEELQMHTEDLKCTQPWVLYVLGMAMSLAVFSRGDCGSQLEYFVLILWDDRDCIDFIRILLGARGHC